LRTDFSKNSFPLSERSKPDRKQNAAIQSYAHYTGNKVV